MEAGLVGRDDDAFPLVVIKRFIVEQLLLRLLQPGQRACNTKLELGVLDVGIDVLSLDLPLHLADVLLQHIIPDLEVFLCFQQLDRRLVTGVEQDAHSVLQLRINLLVNLLVVIFLVFGW